jgi:hypothetical protein
MDMDIDLHGNDKPTTPDGVVRYWLNEIATAKKREKDFRKDGQRILDIYTGKSTKTTPFNILFSNTETLLPALYSAIPRPLVTRRFKDDDTVGRAAAMAGQRVLEFLVDTNLEGYETFDEAMRASTLDGLLPGRGWACVKYDADIEEQVEATPDAAHQEPQTTPYVKGELVCLETRSWNRVVLGYARKWSKVPWIAYEEQIDREEATRLFGRDIATTLKYTTEERERDDEDTEPRTTGERDQGERKTALVYQVWDKDGGKKIRYISAGYREGPLKEEDDPLQLTGFFNCPRPLQFVEKSNDLFPTALYILYENQARELNRLTQRLNKIVEAIKVRGCYAGELSEDLGAILKGDDNELIPAGTGSALAFEKGFQNAIWFLPVGELIVVAEKLYAAREQCKRVIYEITGISDILRGQSVASETATAQTIKNQWGTLRLKRLQNEVQRYARDLLRIMLEIAATKFSEETWAKMTGLPFTTTMESQQLQQIAQAAQMTGQPLDPQTQAKLQAPVWGAVLALLQNDLSRAYRVDIETNSTIEPEAAEDQKNIADMVTAMGQFLNGVGPLVAQGVMPFEVAKNMLLTVARRYRFGNEIEDDIKQMQPPKPPDDGKDAAAKEQLMQAQMAQAQTELDKQKAGLDLQGKQMQAEKQLAAKENDLAMREMKLQMEEQVFKLEKQMAEQSLNLKAQGEHQKLQHEQKVSTLQNTKFKTENVVNQKADATLGTGVKAMQAIVEQLVRAVATQSAEHEQMMQQVTSAITAPRKKRAIRGKDGKIESMEETLA